jgi:glycosyltransferase involved in cell wall biosynthesis
VSRVSSSSDGKVRVHVASFNTCAASELCIRSMRASAGIPFALTVGDSGSHDGSQDMLRALEDRGWLDLEVRAGRKHADWLDDWIRRSDTKYVVLSDSDIQYLRRGWLRELVATADATGAAVVYAERTGEAPNYVHPRTGEVVRLAARPAPWLFLVAADKVSEIDVSFHEDSELRDDLPEGKIVYDVGGLFFREVERRGLALVQMPKAFRRSFRHYAGLSWVYDGEWGRQKAHERRVVGRRLRYVVLRQDGDRGRAAALRLTTELGAGLSLGAQKARKLRHPRRVARRIKAIIASVARERLEQTRGSTPLSGM